MKVNTYYIVSVLCEKDKAFTGDLVTAEDKLVWLGWDGTHGYPAVSPNKKWAQKFPVKPSLQTIRSYDGMPWFYKFKEGSQKIYRITETTYETKYEEEEV